MGDQQAITWLRQGDIGGLVPLMYKYQTQAVRVTYQITGDRQVAEEIVQEAFLKFHRTINRFDTRRLFWPYFRQIITRDAFKVAACFKREISMEYIESGYELPGAGLITSPADQLEASERRQDVKEALKQLSPRQRTIIFLYYLEDLSEREIATELGIALGTVKRDKYDGRKRLTVLLNGHGLAASSNIRT
jgi:RNA polymerase sigma-70 factor (ECF subfamily)